MKKKSRFSIFFLFSLLIFVSCMNNQIRKQPISFLIIDNTFMGVWAVSLNQEKIPSLLPEYSDLGIEIAGQYYPITINPFDANVCEVSIPDTFSEEAIRNGTILYKSIQDNRESVARAASLTIAAVVIDKGILENGTTLYEIEADLFISMRNANVYVFGPSGEFIRPSYVKSSEGYYYTVEVFISARNASPDSSINGTLVFLKSRSNHNVLLQNIFPNFVRYENGKIVVYPPLNTFTITAQSSPTSAGNVRVNAGSWGSSRNLTVNAGSTVTVEASPVSGYTFDGWYTEDSKVSQQNVYVFQLVSGIILKANFIPETPDTTPKLEIQDMNVGKSANFTVPIRGKNLYKVSGFTLEIIYDITKIGTDVSVGSLEALVQLFPPFSGGLKIVREPEPGKLLIDCALTSLNGVNVVNADIANIKLTGKGLTGFTQISFGSKTNFTDEDLKPILIERSDMGSITFY